jgi:hypothetical protein
MRRTFTPASRALLERVGEELPDLVASKMYISMWTWCARRDRLEHRA